MRFRQAQGQEKLQPQRKKNTQNAQPNGASLDNPYGRFYTKDRTFAALVAAKKQTQIK